MSPQLKSRGFKWWIFFNFQGTKPLLPGKMAPLIVIIFLTPDFKLKSFKIMFNRIRVVKHTGLKIQEVMDQLWGTALST